MSGHVRRRGKASFELKFDIGPDPATGKRRIRYRAFKGSKREAEIELAKLIASNATGAYVDPTKLTVAQFIERWRRDWAESNVSPKTLERYVELLTNHVCSRIGNMPLQKVRPVNLAELYAALMRDGRGDKGGLAARTVGHVHRVLHRAFGHATQWGLVSQNVLAVVSPPRVPDTEIAILKQDEVRELLRRLAGRSVLSVASFALATGMRRGEICALRWSDLDLDRGVARVERSLEQTNAGLRFKAPKTRNGRRAISLPASAVAELRAHWKAQGEQRLKLGMGKAPSDALVFARWDGAPRHPDGLTREWSEIMHQIGFPSVTLHSLRHTHASALIAAGLDVLTISRRLGHGSPAVTLRVYGHLFANTDDRAAQIMEAAFGGNRE